MYSTTMTRQLQHEVRNTAVPQSWVGRLLAGTVGLGLAALAVLFFTVFLIAATALGIAFSLYLLHGQRKAQRSSTDGVIDGEYTVLSAGREERGSATEGSAKARETSL